MIANYFTLRAVARDLDRLLVGCAITDIYTQEREELVLSMGDTAHLLASCRKETNCWFLLSSMSRARRNSVDLLSGAVGGTITRVRMHESDRIASISLDNARTLVFQFFASTANILLVHDTTIEDAFTGAAKIQGSSFTHTPPSPLLDLVRLQEALGGTGRLSDMLRKNVPQLGALLAREVVHRTGLTEHTGPLPEKSWLLLRATLLELLEELESPRPVVYRQADDDPPTFALIPLRSLAQIPSVPYEDIHEAIRSTVFAQRGNTAFQKRRDAILHILENFLQKRERTISAITADIASQQRAEEYQHAGDLLLAHLASIPTGAKEVVLDDNDRPVVIPLDPSLTPSRNAQRYFAKAKRSRTARVESGERLPSLQRGIEKAQSFREALRGAHTPVELAACLSEHGTLMDELGLNEKGEEKELPPFRIFVVDGGFEVWAGKSSQNNDLLTLRHARPNDLWFHARGASGSHVVLRVGSGKGTPGKKAREQAAGIAAYYSRMKKAKLVPVAMTERKYVRKPKGAPAGTVVLEREQVIFASPALPESPLS
jgi:predicted ribosome quality control (RQC) complex YloA/Tae2 family protein